MAAYKITGFEDVGFVIGILGDGGRDVVLGRFEFSNFLERYLCNQVSERGAVSISEMLEMNECVHYEDRDDLVINDVLFDMANSDINGPLTRSRVAGFIGLLRQKKSGLNCMDVIARDGREFFRAGYETR